MNIMRTANRLLLGIALPGMLMMGAGVGSAYGKGLKSTMAAMFGEKPRSTQVAQRATCSGQPCKVLRAKGLCPSTSGMCKSCEQAHSAQGGR